MRKGSPRYIAYLVRLWAANSSGPPEWRAMVEDPQTGQRWGFADLQLLCAFLNEQMGGTRQKEDDASPTNADD